MISLFISLLSSIVFARVYFSEEFPPDWEARWMPSTNPDLGRFILSPGWWFSNITDTGIKTLGIDQNFALSCRFPPFTNRNQPFILQYTLKNEQNLECGGGYLKILPANFIPSSFSRDTPFLLLFGPDICNQKENGLFMITYKGNNYKITKNLKIPTNDRDTHQYTLALYPNNTFAYYVDNDEIERGDLRKHFELPIEREDEDVYVMEQIGGVGIEVVQTPSGSVFDNIFIGDSIDEAREFSSRTFEYKVREEPRLLKEYERQQNELKEKYARMRDL